MKKILMFAAAVALWTAPAAFAQDINHGEVGVFGEYYRFSPAGSVTHTNFAGVGGRLSVNVATSWQLEAETSYDFRQVASSGLTAGTPGIGSVAVGNTGLRVLHALFGPKVQTGGGPVRLFGTVKGGLVNFRSSTAPATVGAITTSLTSLNSSNVNGVLYPGGGVEAYLWIFGWRTDVGDEIFFSNGAHHNLRITFGPHIRF